MLRIRPEDKQVLLDLQESWLRLRGERPTQQDLVGKAIAYARRHEHEFLAESAWTPLSDAEWKRLQSLPTNMGKWNVGDGIDDVVYR